jgi:hypothetical protein
VKTNPFPEPNWDKESLAALIAEYNKEFAKFDLYPDGWMGKRGEADETTRHIGCAGAWGLFPNEDAVYINYNGHLPAVEGDPRIRRLELRNGVIVISDADAASPTHVKLTRQELAAFVLGTRAPSAADPLSQLDRVLDRSHLMPPGAVESVMKGMHDAGAWE